MFPQIMPNSQNTQATQTNINIGTHTLHLSTSGPARQKVNGTLQPAVIIEAGLGSGLSEWVSVQRHLSKKAKVYTYDRAGYGKSEVSPFSPGAENRVRELLKLLEVADIPPPYVLVGHSYGGVLVREFLRVNGNDVVGMVVVDSARVRTPLPTGLDGLLGDCSYQGIVGLDENCVLSDEEYARVKQDEVKNSAMAGIEERFMEESTARVNDAMPVDSQALGDGRLSVIFANESVDFRKIYDFAVVHGLGTDEARNALAERLEDMGQIDEAGQRAHLGLSSQSRFVYAEGKATTHNLQYVAPEVIAMEVFWVLGLSD